MEFNLVDLKIVLELTGPGQPCLFGLEASFSLACRQTICGRDSCGDCLDREGCPWRAVFAQELSSDRDALKRHQKPPLPYAFSFPGTEVSQGAFECRLVVVGKAINHLQMLLGGFSRMLATLGKGCIVGIWSRDYQGEYAKVAVGPELDHRKNLAVLSAATLVDCPGLGFRLKINILSPLKLVSDGRPLARFDFSIFARMLMRRVSSLAYYYGDCELDYDFKVLATDAAEVEAVQERFGYRRELCGDRKLCGIVGSGIFEGDFSGLMPVLVLGSYLHVGKKAAFGLGAFEIEAA